VAVIVVVIPAKAETHGSTVSGADQCIRARAGMTA